MWKLDPALDRLHVTGQGDELWFPCLDQPVLISHAAVKKLQALPPIIKQVSDLPPIIEVLFA